MSYGTLPVDGIDHLGAVRVCAMRKTLARNARIGQVRQCLRHAHRLEEDGCHPSLPEAYYAKLHRTRQQIRKDASRLLLHVMH